MPCAVVLLLNGPVYNMSTTNIQKISTVDLNTLQIIEEGPQNKVEEKEEPKIEEREEENDPKDEAQEEGKLHQELLQAFTTINQMAVPAKDLKKDEDIQQQLPKQENGDFYNIDDMVEERFRLKTMFKQGTFGQIYKADDTKTSTLVAIKFEKKVHGCQNIEGTVLKAVQGCQNFPILYAVGSTERYFYVAMQLLNENLSEIRHSCSLIPPRLSISTTYRTMVQCLTALEALHNFGFIHRDIKPSNFAVGMNGMQHRVIYMLDFNLCRNYVYPDGTVREARSNVGFRGTVRYASLAAHEKKELCRCDDLWSLFYSFLELLTGELPWKKSIDKDEVYRMKKEHSAEVLCQLYVPEMFVFVHHLQNLNFADKPDYALLTRCLNGIMQNNKVNFSDPYDWELFDCSSVEHWNPSENVSNQW